MLLHNISLLLSLCASVRALSAISGSPCYSACNGDNATASSDIVCTDSDFTTSPRGQLFKKCMGCLSTSTYVKSTRSDATLFLFYLSTVQQICVSSSSSTTRSGCGSRCSGIDSSFTQTGPEFFASPYTYCSANNGGYGNTAGNCSSCLQSQTGTVILGNFVQVGNDACQTRANVTNGDLVSVGIDMFNSTASSASGAMTTTSPGVNGTTTTSRPSNSTTTDASEASTTVVGMVPQSSTFASSYATPATASRSGAASVTGIGGEDVASSGKSSISPGVAAATGILVGGAGLSGIVALALLARKRQQRVWREGNGHIDFPEKSSIGQHAAARSATLTTPAIANQTWGLPDARGGLQPVQKTWQNSF